MMGLEKLSGNLVSLFGMSVILKFMINESYTKLNIVFLALSHLEYLFSFSCELILEFHFFHVSLQCFEKMKKSQMCI